MDGWTDEQTDRQTDRQAVRLMNLYRGQNNEDVVREAKVGATDIPAP